MRLIALAILIAALAVWCVAAPLTRHEAIRQLTDEAELLARQHGRLIDSELSRFRLLPVVLGEYGDLAGALSSGSAGAAARLSDKLGFLARETGASRIYLIDRNGVAISASNSRSPDSFVGQNFGFRPYFKESVRNGSAEYYGAGILTGRSGLFLARRVGGAGSEFGVVVVKYEFDTLSRVWAGDAGKTLVIDANGIVLAAPEPSQLLTTLQPLRPETRARIEAVGQYGDAALTPGDYEFAGPARISTRQGETMVYAALPVAGTDLRLLHLLDTRAALAAAGRRAGLLTLAAMPLLLAGTLAVWWQSSRAARAAADRRALEDAVLEQTKQLREEMGRRADADRRFRDAREELAQANRLAAVGSIAAGLMHEINQPVATIRALSENAMHHLAANRLDRVRDGLGVTVEMTERIGSLTQEMRGFSRRRQGEVGTEPLDAVIAGTMLLMEDRIRKAGIRLDCGPTGQSRVLGERVRLEQVLVNLLQNAVEALKEVSDPRIAVIVERSEDHVRLIVADNGPGIDPRLGNEVFLPFVTGKPNGLGLGLGIAQDIMRDFGGSLSLGASPLGGAAFVVTMRPA